MKKFATTAILALTVGSSVFATEGEFTADDLVKATQVSIKSFSEENASHASHLSGFKTWKSGTEAKVKIYVAHDGMTMEYNYLCQNHGGQIHCSEM